MDSGRGWTVAGQLGKGVKFAVCGLCEHVLDRALHHHAAPHNVLIAWLTPDNASFFMVLHYWDL
jgi:hypothetical protein